MKICPNCHNQCVDDALFCTICGTTLSNYTAPQQPNGNPQQPYGTPQQHYAQTHYAHTYAPRPMTYDPHDHTAEFDPADIAENKLVCMIVYLLGAIGVIIALLMSGNSEYVRFHVRQSLKITVLELVVSLATALLCWTIIVPIAAGIFSVVLFVVKLICFSNVCKGLAKDAAVVRGFKFLN